MTIDLNQLRSERRELFDQCMRVGSFNKLLEIEVALANSIRQTEHLLKEGNNGNLQFHIKRLRLYADGLVWLVLHPHAIRNLAKNADVRKVLLDQGESFDLVMQSARNHLKRRKVPVLIADITNIIKIGDIIVVNNSEAPMIVETKKHLPKPKHLMQGRIGRQISRAMGTSKYLRDGSAKVYGDDHYRHTIETPYKSQRNWEIVDKVCTLGIRDGWSEIILSKHEVMWAYTRQQEQKFYSEIQRWNGKDSALFLGTSLGLMNMSDGLFSPPGVWPISPDVRFALLEEDIVLVHLLDAAAFEYKSENSESIKIDSKADFPVIVTLSGKEYPLSRRFIYDVLYGFETVESCIDGLLQFGRQLHRQSLDDLPKTPETKPSISYIATVEQALELARKATQNEEDLVAIAPDLLAKLRNVRGIKLRASNRSTDWGRWGYYALMTVAELRKLLEKGPK